MPNKIQVNSQSMFGDKNFISNISLNYPSGFFGNIKLVISELNGILLYIG